MTTESRPARRGIPEAEFRQITSCRHRAKLEPIHDFRVEASSASRTASLDGAVTAELILDEAMDIETRAVSFHLLAAEKMSALPEISRLLTKVGKSRAENQKRLESAVR